MTWITLTGVGLEVVAGGTSAADPQLQFFENFPGHLVGDSSIDISNVNFSISLHAVNIPLSLSFNYPIMLLNKNNTTTTNYALSVNFGLYSLNGSTLSLANSAQATTSFTNESGLSWLSFVTSATQNITPGTWYFGVGLSNTSRPSGVRFVGNTSINPGNAIPGGFLMGRNTVSTQAMPASIATSDMDITGSDAIRQFYIIITA